MRVDLILPAIADNIDAISSSSLVSKIICGMLGWGKTSYTPPLSLLTLATVTPPDIDLRIVDERIEKIDFDAPVDLIGITVVTRAAPRAYEIAAEYRRRGVKVVMGGIHPSAMREEAAQHADVVVLGEGEYAWPQLLNDYQQGALQPIYRGQPVMDLDALPIPRRDLLKRPDYYVTTKVITATRGCPNSCTFCAAGAGLSKKYRKRKVENVVRELEQIPGKVAIFVDDNIGWDVEYAKELIRALIPLKLRWSGAVSANALEDQELIDLAAKSGCFMLGVGFESLSPTVLASIRKDKTNKPERYAAGIQRIQEAGMAVWGNFIVGFDDDDLNTFDQLVDFIHQTYIEIANIYTLIPYPGCLLYRQYDRSGRIFSKDWNYYDPVDGPCVYIPSQMSPNDLMDHYLCTLDKVFSINSFLGRLVKSKSWLSFGSLAALHLNLESRHCLPDQKARVRSFQQDMRSKNLSDALSRPSETYFAQEAVAELAD